MSYWSWERVACPVCKQPVGEKCRTLKTGRLTDTHIPRLELGGWHFREGRVQ
ncbi:zinc finger domain-containing protein [Mycolicibacter kumamotonensis]|uniref:zinc finger domain-containing protein n=1 Tax=Mycolicibacter kumamotonensis TaxID=354243 RepID=UPI0026814C1B